ncbi:MAG TPA: glycosyltransferase family 1 protein [Opitutaceae bacterium]|nr:glycosyltransferase family 1 protein [Opitutaceae bacterium]
MKLAIVTETFPPEINGVAMTFDVIAREFGRRGHAVTVYRPWRSDLAAAASHPEYREVPLPGLPIPGYSLLRLGLPARRRLTRRWRAERPDLVHVVTEGPLGASAVTAARALALPVTSSFHTNFHAYTPHYRLGLLRRVALGWLRHVHNRTRRTFAPTEELRRELAGHGFTGLGVLSRGVDLRQFSPTRRSPELRAAWQAHDGEVVVLHVGRFAAEKNYPLLFRAYAAMRAANPRLRCVLVGDGPLRPALQAAHPECRFTGFIPRDDLARHYASADIYVHASLTETFGNVLTEALASGLAVAGFDYAAARQFVRDGANGLVVPCDQPDALVAAAAQLAANRPLRDRLRAAGPESLSRQSWAEVVGRFEAELTAAAAAPR